MIKLNDYIPFNVMNYQKSSSSKKLGTERPRTRP